MVDLAGQYERLKHEIDGAISTVISGTRFINGPEVQKFAENLRKSLDAHAVVTCGNGTDALMIALRAAGLETGDEVIVPAFTYIASAEVIAFLGMKPVFVDVDPRYFNMDVSKVERSITAKTRAIIPVHLYGQCADMEPIMDLAARYNLKVIEDNAQSIGARYRFGDGREMLAGTIGDIGCLSFFPSKNLGCYGDGGAMVFKNEEYAEMAHLIANHGQRKKYHHEIIGFNSRLDTLQAAVLDVKLKYLDDFKNRRQAVAAVYDEILEGIEEVSIPKRAPWSDHVFHQYTIRLNGVDRDLVKEKLWASGIPSMVYYPLPLHQQEAMKAYATKSSAFPVAEKLCGSVLSLPIHTEMDRDMVEYIAGELVRVVRMAK